VSVTFIQGRRARCVIINVLAGWLNRTEKVATGTRFALCCLDVRANPTGGKIRGWHPSAKGEQGGRRLSTNFKITYQVTRPALPPGSRILITASPPESCPWSSFLLSFTSSLSVSSISYLCFTCTLFHR
jgi:hypothetical protein